MHNRQFLWILLAFLGVLAGCSQRESGETQAVAKTDFPENPTSAEVTRLDLTNVSRDHVDDAIQKLPVLEKIEQVYADPSELMPADVLLFRRIFPDAEFHYEFTLLGQPVNTDDEIVEIVDAEPGEHYEEDLRQALELLNHCKELRLDNCNVNNEVMASIREDFRDKTKVVWRIFFAKRGSCMTDRTVIRYVYNMDDSNCSALRYCEDAEYVDFGHNETLSDCSWAAGMPKLKAAILSGSLVSDLSAFEQCTDLEFLELAYCSKVKDLSPLSGCKKLQMVNTSFTGVSDFSPLDGIKLERLCSVHCKARAEEQERFCRLHPECLTLFRGKQPYGYCWRYEKDGYTPTAYYAKLKEVFHYPDTHDTTW